MNFSLEAFHKHFNKFYLLPNPGVSIGFCNFVPVCCDVTRSSSAARWLAGRTSVLPPASFRKRTDRGGGKARKRYFPCLAIVSGLSLPNGAVLRVLFRCRPGPLELVKAARGGWVRPGDTVCWDPRGWVLAPGKVCENWTRPRAASGMAEEGPGVSADSRAAGTVPSAKASLAVHHV